MGSSKPYWVAPDGKERKLHLISAVHEIEHDHVAHMQNLKERARLPSSNITKFSAGETVRITNEGHSKFGKEAVDAGCPGQAMVPR